AQDDGPAGVPQGHSLKSDEPLNKRLRCFPQLMPPGHASSPLTVVSVCSCLPANTFMSGQEEGNGVFDDTHLKMS
ncbi:Hypothetical protein SMAX5B_009157, partial [Scophthalmus maximus]